MAAGGRAAKRGREVARVLRANGWDVRVYFTDEHDDLHARARRVPQQLVGAVGGDGYLAAVAAATLGKVLVPFLGGRGNDLCRALGLGTSATRRAANLPARDWERRIRQVDGMWVESGERTTLAVGVVSLGIDAAANRVANQLRCGSTAYAWGAVLAFFRHRFPRITGVIDGQTFDFTGWVASVSNSGWLGGGINLVPTSRMDDGHLEVFTAARASRWRIFPLLARALTIGVPDSPLIQVRTAQEVRISADAPVSAMADGDQVAATPLTVRVAPGAITILA